MSAPPPRTAWGPRPSRLPTVLALFALILAVAAAALSGWTWWQSRARPTYTYTDAEIAAAKSSGCSAYASVRSAVDTNTNLTPPGGDGDVTGALAVAANARVALIGGGQYLLDRVQPATPTELAGAMRDLGNKLMDFGAAAAAGARNTDPAQASLLRDIGTANDTLGRLCGT
jgi:hypothetical protein